MELTPKEEELVRLYRERDLFVFAVTKEFAEDVIRMAESGRDCAGQRYTVEITDRDQHSGPGELLSIERFHPHGWNKPKAVHPNFPGIKR